MGEAKTDTPQFLKTSEFAELLKIQPDSLRKAVYRGGAYYGIRPQRLHNGRLAWPYNQVMDLVYGKRRPDGVSSA